MHFQRKNDNIYLNFTRATSIKTVTIITLQNFLKSMKGLRLVLLLCVETLQDRWVIELRLRNVRTIDEANQVLPELVNEHNKRFAVKPKVAEKAYVPLNDKQSLNLILSRPACAKPWGNHFLSK